MPSTHPAPDPNVLFYRRTRENGREEVATMQTIEQTGTSWRGRFMIPGQAPYFMDQFSDELENWEPIYAITENDISNIIERVAQRVVEILGEAPKQPSEIVVSAMEVLNSGSLEAAIEKAAEICEPEEEYSCPKCSKTYKYEKSYMRHVSTCSA